MGISHRSASVCHLGAIALRLGEKLNWDPEREQYIGDPQADHRLRRKMRKPGAAAAEVVESRRI